MAPDIELFYPASLIPNSSYAMKQKINFQFIFFLHYKAFLLNFLIFTCFNLYLHNDKYLGQLTKSH